MLMIYAHHFSCTRHKKQYETLVTKVSNILWSQSFYCYS